MLSGFPFSKYQHNEVKNGEKWRADLMIDSTFMS